MFTGVVKSFFFSLEYNNMRESDIVSWKELSSKICRTNICEWWVPRGPQRMSKEDYTELLGVDGFRGFGRSVTTARFHS